MNIDNLVKMANQIGQFFESYPCHEEAVQGVADHLKRFWAPAMRAALIDHAGTQGDDSSLAPLTLEAVRLLARPTQDA